MELAIFRQDIEYLHSAMIDWLTLKIDLVHLPENIIRQLQSLNSKIFKVNAVSGETEWETYAWESVKSDTHQVCFRIGGEFSIQGSPARLGLKNNAFGSLDINYCANKMIQFAIDQLQLGSLPTLKLWTCSRIDVARNYAMQSGAEARQALSYLKQSPESRQKHSYESFGLYIGKGSTLHRGKIYLKGQDAKRNQRSGRACYSEAELLKSERLLRAELTLARHSISRLRTDKNIHWYNLNPELLLQLHTDYFKDYFSDIEVTDMSSILEKLIKHSPTEGQASSAYDCYIRIRTYGYDQAKVTYTKTSWYRHLKNLKASGFTRADLVPINVIPLKKRAIQLNEPVCHWNDIEIAS